MKVVSEIELTNKIDALERHMRLLAADRDWLEQRAATRGAEVERLRGVLRGIVQKPMDAFTMRLIASNALEEGK